MCGFKNKYSNADPILSQETRKKNIAKLVKSQLKQKKVVRKDINIKRLDGDAWFNMKPDIISHRDEEDVYKIINRDILLGNGLKRVEVGKIFKIGTIKDNKKSKFF